MKKQPTPTFSWRGDKKEVPAGCGESYDTQPDSKCAKTDKEPRLAKKLEEAEEKVKRDVCAGCGAYFADGSEERSSCKDQCKEAQAKDKNHKYNLCSDTCLYGKQDKK